MARTNTTLDSSDLRPQDRRREQRIAVEYPIEVSGFDCMGRFGTEDTSTQDVSGSSCSFHLKMEVEKGMVLAIRMLADADNATPAPVLFYVTRVDRTAKGYCIGAVKLAPRAPWNAEIHDANAHQKFLF
jgi:PilZ domain